MIRDFINDYDVRTVQYLPSENARNIQGIRLRHRKRNRINPLSELGRSQKKLVKLQGVMGERDASNRVKLG